MGAQALGNLIQAAEGSLDGPDALERINAVMREVTDCGGKFSTYGGGLTVVLITAGEVQFTGEHKDCFRATLLAAKRFLESLAKEG
jgi:hypothetical protein